MGAGKWIELARGAVAPSRNEGFGSVVGVNPVDELHRLVPFVTPELRRDLRQVLSIYDQRGEGDQLDRHSKLKRDGLEVKAKGDSVQQGDGMFDACLYLCEETPVGIEVVLGERCGHC